MVVAMAAGSTGERPFFEIITSIRYWVIHAVTLPAIFLAGFTTHYFSASFKLLGQLLSQLFFQLFCRLFC